MNTSTCRSLRTQSAALLAILPALLLAPAARAQNITLPNVHLPISEPTVPTLWGPVSALQSRITGTSSAAHYAAVKSHVDGNLSKLATSPGSYNDNDQSLVDLAKEAALLQALNVTPPSSSFASYGDAAVAALTHVGTRVSSSIGGSTTPPNLNLLQDSPRLQSMAEAYDLLRGASTNGCSTCAANDAAMRSIIDAWANAVYGDSSLNGFFGAGGHRDNWGIKGASALFTAALTLSTSSDASNWMTFANTVMLESMQNMASSAGWYRESAHYLNYGLDDLFSTAVQVQYRTGLDWLTPLKPFAQAAFDLRQPDGTEAPFEEGVPCVFPFDVFAPYYADIGGNLVWAWNHSTKDTDSWGNQQAYEATRFLAGELPTEEAPTGRVSRFANGDAHISALRTGFDANALQATLFAARDYADESHALITSYHDTNNPLDLVVAGLGQTLMPTSSGGPEVTTSPNRSYYLLASSKNVPLVNNTAPYITDASRITSDLELAGSDGAGMTGRYLDLARSTYFNGTSSTATAVARTVGLVGGQYIVVVDEMDIKAGASASVGLPLHGRGAFSIIDAFHSPIRLNWAYQGLALDTFTIASMPFSAINVTGPNAGYYASSYGAEESIEGAQINQAAGTSGAPVRSLTIFDARTSDAGTLAVEDRTQSATPLPGLLAARVTQGTTVDHVASAPQQYLPGDGGVDAGPVLSPNGIEMTNIDGVSTDALFSTVRENSGEFVSFGVGHATTLSFKGAQVLFSTNPITLSFNAVGADGGSFAADGGPTATGYIGAVSADGSSINSFAVRGLAGFDPGLAWTATFENAPISTPNFIQLADGFQFGGLVGGGTITVSPQGSQILPPIPAQTIAEGQQLAFIVPANPPNGQTLTFSLATATTYVAPNVPSIDPVTGAFTWTPGYDVATSTTPTDVVVIISASTGALTVSQACHILVTNTDRAPVLQPIAEKIVRRQSNFALQLVGTDPDGDALTYSYQPQHAFPAPLPIFDPHAGTFAWNAPANATLGTYPIDFTVSDGQLTTTQTMQLIVEDVNHAPVFSTVNGQTLPTPTTFAYGAIVNTPISLLITATDADNDPLTYTARQPRGDLPTGATFNAATHTFAWTPNALGETSIIVRVEDNYGGQSELQLTINVTEASGCTSGGVPGPLALLLGLMLLARARRRTRAAL